MKKFRSVAAALICAMLLISCNKDDSAGFSGSYSYKTSGTVTLMAKDLAGLDAQTLAAYKAMGINVDPVTVGLNPEQGQMHVLDGGDGKFIVTFNNILGNADVASATIADAVMTLSGTDVKAVQLTDGKETIGSGIVMFGGSGKRYDDMLIIDLEYKGMVSINGVEMVVTGCNVACVAQKN